MYQFDAVYYNGKSSGKHEVHCEVNEDGLLNISNQLLSIPIDQLTIRPRIGSAARQIVLENGGLLETLDNDVIDELSEHWKIENKEKLAHFLESNLKFVYLSIVVLVVIAVIFFKYGLPAASHYVVKSLPTSIDDRLGEEILPQLDEILFSPSQLKEEAQREIGELFESLIPIDDNRNYQLVFRDAGPLGANAFALPNGTVVMTDAMVELVSDHQQLSGILLHEIGHVRHRHSMESLVQKAGVATTLLLMTGDVSVASSLVFLLPTVLLESSYSRKAETESDDYAYDQMASLGIPHEYFAVVMERLMGQHESPADEKACHDEADHDKPYRSQVFDYFSTHPPTQQRIDRFRQ